jgi:hypothetical protein
MALARDVSDPFYVNGTTELDYGPHIEDGTQENRYTTMPKVPRRFDRPSEVLDLTEESWESWEFTYKREEVLHMTPVTSTFHGNLSARRTDTDTNSDTETESDSDSDMDGRPSLQGCNIDFKIYNTPSAAQVLH